MEKKTKITSPIDELKNAQRSEQTLDRYEYYVKRFCKYHNTTPEKLLTLKDDAIRIFQKDYLVYLNNQNKSRSYIAGIVSGLDKFFVMNDREGAMLTRKLRDSIIPQTQTQKLSGRGAWEDKDIKLMMETADNIQTKAIIGILNSTGGRLGIISENIENNSRYLKYEDIVDDSNKFNFVGQGREIEKIEFGNCKAIRLYSDTGSEYWSFLTSSASAILDRHLKLRRFNEPSFRDSPKGQPLFVARDRKTKQLKPASYSDIKQAIGNIIKKIRGTLPEGQKRHDIQMTNGFRHRFVDKAIQSGMQPLAISKLM